MPARSRISTFYYKGVILVLIASSSLSSSTTTADHTFSPNLLSGRPSPSSSLHYDDVSLKIHNALFDLRGGAAKRPKNKAKTSSLSSSAKKTATGKKRVGAANKNKEEQEKKSALSETVQKYKKILPLTRIYITMVAVTTLLGLILGEELTQGLLALDPTRVLYGMELWRPFTAASFLGPPSIGWLMSSYYLFEYGSSLERAYGTAQHLIFLASQLVLLSIFSILTGQPFFGPSLITAMLHVLSRAMPHQKAKLIIFTVPYWSMPYGLMMVDVLQAQSAMAALPHVLGILSGHFYHFHKFIWPKMGGVDWLVAPAFISKRLDPDARATAAQENANKAFKNRKRKGGRKLGSA
jgi:membrane associated rhomboid family serine protease